MAHDTLPILLAAIFIGYAVFDLTLGLAMPGHQSALSMMFDGLGSGDNQGNMLLVLGMAVAVAFLAAWVLRRGREYFTAVDVESSEENQE